MQSGSFKLPQGTVFIIPLVNLIIIEAGQRRLKLPQIAVMKKGFDLDYLGFPTVSRGIKGSKIYPRLPKGKYYLVDGRQRVTVLLALGFKEIGVLLPHGNKGAEVLFIGLNGGEESVMTKSNVTRNEMFKVNYWSEHDPEVFIVDTLHKHGIEVTFGAGKPALGCTKAVDAFKGLYKVTGRRQFSQAVKLIVRNFGRPDGIPEAAALASDFLKGLSLYLQSTATPLQEISTALGKADRSSAAIIARAKHVAGRNGWVYRQTIANEIGRLVKKGSK